MLRHKTPARQGIFIVKRDALEIGDQIAGDNRRIRPAAIRAQQSLRQKPLLHAWYVDETYAKVAGGPGLKGFDLAALFDRRIIDGAVNGVATAARGLGTSMQSLQTGYVRNSALGIVVGSVAVVAWFLSRLWQ